MSEEVLTFKVVAIGDRFSFHGLNYTKVSYNKARCDERREGEGPTRFRDEDVIGPEIKPAALNPVPPKAVEPVKPQPKPHFQAEPLAKETAKPQGKPAAKPEEKKEPAPEADKK